MTRLFAAWTRNRQAGFGTFGLWTVLAAAVMFVSCGAPVRAADRAAAIDPEPRPDPSILRGTLANGLRYAVRSNAKPSSALSIRFYIETGSIEEKDEERGIAHFIEHMAFEGGRQIRGEDLTSRFQQAGISVERDHNAFTNLIGTYYVMDLQEVSPAKIDLALTWLRDVADGLAFDPQAMDRQRGVVMSEYVARRDGGTAVAEAIKAFFEPNLLDVRRSPGGTPQTLKAMTPEMLRAFYSRWYRPDRAFIILVGDLPAEQLKARVEQMFGSWTVSGPMPSAPDVGSIDLTRKTAAFAVHTPNFAEGVVEVCRPARADPHTPPGVQSWANTIADVGWMLPLQQRLDHLARASDAPIVSARIDRSETDKAWALTCVSATPKPDRWRDTVALISDEMRRMELHGVSQAEFDRAMTVISARVDAMAASARTSSQLAQGLIPTLLERDVAIEPETIQKLFAAARKRASLADVKGALRRRWTDAAEPLLAMVSIVPATPTDLRSAWSDALARPDPAPPVFAATDTWAYTDFGPPGRVVDRQEISDPSFVRVTFANGVRANIKTLRSEHDRVEIRVRLGAGQLELHPDDLPIAYVGAGVVVNGGLERHDDETINRILEAHAASIRFSMERDHFTLAGSSRTVDAGLVAQALAAFLTEPAFRPESDRRVPLSVRTFYTNNRTNPLVAAQKALRDSLPGPLVFPLPPEKIAAGYKASDFERVLKPVLTADPVEVTIVGDISEDDAVKLLARSLGAIARRGAATGAASPDAVRLHFPTEPIAPIAVRHVGLPSKAGVIVVWPLFPWTPDRQREVRSLTLLREVLSDRVRRVIRERLGQTYTPEVNYSAERGGDDSALTVAIETSPTAVAGVANEVRAIGKALSRGDITSEELERIRKPLLDDTAHRRETAGWWLTTLDGSYADPYRLAQARTWQADYSSISVAEVNASAVRWLAREPVLAFALPQATDPTIRSAPAPKSVVP